MFPIRKRISNLTEFVTQYLSFRNQTLIKNLHSSNKEFLGKTLMFESKVPQVPNLSNLFNQTKENIERIKVDEASLKLLQRWSLVKLDDDKALNTLLDAINFADKIADVETDGVEPLYTVLESRMLRLRSDIVIDGNCREAVLSNAHLIEENYFVAPPGNVPLIASDKILSENAIENTS